MENLIVGKNDHKKTIKKALKAIKNMFISGTNKNNK